MSFSFIHLSDIHLGRPFSGLSEFVSIENNFEIFKKAVNKSLERVLNFAIENKVDFILISGDTFDSSESDFSSIYYFKKLLKRFEENEIGVFVICGNHDPIISYNKNTFDFNENSIIKIIGLNTPAIAKLPIYKNNKIEGYIHSASFQNTNFNGKLLENFTEINPQDFNIALLHCDINGIQDSPYAPCLLSELKAFNFDYCALGHIHTPTDFGSNICYAGTLQGRNVKENGEHGIRYICVENNKIIKNNFVPMDIIRYENKEINLTDLDDETLALDKILEEINLFINSKPTLCEVYLISLKLTGKVNFYEKINEDFYKELIERTNDYSTIKILLAKIENLLKPKIDDKLLRDDNGITGELYKILNDNNELEQLYIKAAYEIEKACIGTLDKEQILNSVKEDCKNLCSNIYSDIKED